MPFVTNQADWFVTARLCRARAARWPDLATAIALHCAHVKSASVHANQVTLFAVILHFLLSFRTAVIRTHARTLLCDDVNLPVYSTIKQAPLFWSLHAAGRRGGVPSGGQTWPPSARALPCDSVNLPVRNQLKHCIGLRCMQAGAAAPRGGQTWCRTVITLLGMSLGFGLWMLPFDYARLGWLGGTVAVLVMAGAIAKADRLVPFMFGATCFTSE